MNNWTVQLSTHRINTKWQWRAQWRVKCTWWQEGSKNLLPLLLLRQTENGLLKAADCVAVVLVLSPFFVPSTHRHGGRILVCCCWGLICTQDTEMQKRTQRRRRNAVNRERERHSQTHTHKGRRPFSFHPAVITRRPRRRPFSIHLVSKVTPSILLLLWDWCTLLKSVNALPRCCCCCCSIPAPAKVLLLFNIRRRRRRRRRQRFLFGCCNWRK